MGLFVVTAVGADRPGIVAALSGVLLAEGGNLEDLSMTILGGHFTMVLVVDGPDVLDPVGLERRLSGAAPGVRIAVGPLRETLGDPDEGEVWIASVSGADRPGIVYGAALLLAEAGANVTDLTTRVSDDGGAVAYTMLMELRLPDEKPATAAALADGLRALSTEKGVVCTLAPADADIL